jgi:hypothetical protein
MNAKLPDDVRAALAYAERSQGWNNRRGDVQRFTLPNRWGHDPCQLYVVPARAWAYRQSGWNASEGQRRHGGAA